MIHTGMKCLAIVAAFVLVATHLTYSQVIIADNFNVTGNGTGFALNSGVNSGIVPPATRLTGTAAAGLRYISTGTKASTAFSIATNKLQVAFAANPGRFTLSPDGVVPFDFSSAFRSSTATVQVPVVYDIAISMANKSTNISRFSFALGSVEGDATTWDFGIQLYRNANADNFYTIGKRVDAASAGLASDVNTFITNTAPGTFGTEIHFLVRVTDAGAETNTFNSRVQLSMDGGVTWFYDTASDADLPNGWRLDGPGRYVMWDVAPSAGTVIYDNFSIVPVPASIKLVSPPDNAKNLGAPVLKVAVSNALPGDLTVTFFGREAPKPYPGPDFCIPVLPDTQNYAREAPDAASRQMWYAQTDWIVENRVKENIAYVAHLGDIVQNGDVKNGNPNTLEWSIATNAMYRLEKESTTLLTFGIPYGAAVGNHDQTPIGDENGTTTFFNDYFGVSHFSDRPYYGGNYGSNNDSHFDLFSASGLDFIVLYFEYGRYGSAILDWANAVLATNQHRRAIVVTHHAGGVGTPNNLSTQGQAIYDALKVNTNFFMMLGGHIHGEGSRQNTYNGNVVRTFVSDYQGETNGGDGWMRLMYFSPTNNQVVIQTYNPYRNLYQTDEDSEMFFNYSLRLPTGPGSPGTPYVALATNFNVAAGSITSASWPGLQANKTYEWYARVTDSFGNTLTSPRWRFSTTVNAAPVASNQTVTVVGDQPTQLTMLASDSNGDPFTFQIETPAIRGLNTDLDPASGTVTYLPAHGYRGLDRFTYRASDSLTNSAGANFDLIVTSPPDTNGNGIPDGWETAYGIVDPDADADGDGHSNRNEYFANTNPTNAGSHLKILNAGWDTNGHFTLRWTAIGGTRYRVQNSDFVTPGSNAFTDVIGTVAGEMSPAPYGTPATQTFVEPQPSTNQMRVYRVKVNP